jgi:hypothetical protein
MIAEFAQASIGHRCLVTWRRLAGTCTAGTSCAFQSSAFTHRTPMYAAAAAAGPGPAKLETVTPSEVEYVLGTYRCVPTCTQV